MWLFNLCTASLLVSAGGFAAQPALLYTASRHGEVEPCGCQVNQIGGLDRLAAKINQARKVRDVFFVDAGNAFFSSLRPALHRREQDLRKAQLISESYRIMGLDAYSPGERDFAEGEKVFIDLVERSGAALVSANLKLSKAKAKTHLILERGGFRLGVTGLTTFAAKSPAGVEALPPEKNLRSLFDSTKKEKIHRWVVLANLSSEEERKIAEAFPGIWMVGSRSMDFHVSPLERGESFFFEPGIEGQRVGEIVLSENERGFQEAKLTELGSEFVEEGPVKQAMKKYYQSLKNLPLAPAPTPPAKREAAWVANPFKCRSCHEPQFEFWKNTPHSSAVIALYEKGQQDDPSCVACHSIGYQEQGGFSQFRHSIQSQKNKQGLAEKILKLTTREKTKENQHKTYWKELEAIQDKEKITKVFWGVQCEHCHENRAEHVRIGEKVGKGVSLASCQNCHRSPNAPEFDPKSLVKVACPKMREKDA